jgi:hypothetical protein
MSDATKPVDLAALRRAGGADAVRAAITADCYQLATVAVGAAVTSIVNANITDNRTTTTSGLVTAAGGMLVCTSSARPSTAAEGQLIYETDTDKMLVYQGAAWVEWSHASNAWQTYTPSVTNITLGTGGTITGKWRRWGLDVEFEAIAQLGSAGHSAPGMGSDWPSIARTLSSSSGVWGVPPALNFRYSRRMSA